MKLFKTIAYMNKIPKDERSPFSLYLVKGDAKYLDIVEKDGYKKELCELLLSLTSDEKFRLMKVYENNGNPAEQAKYL